MTHGEEDPIGHGKARAEAASKAWLPPTLPSTRGFIFLPEPSFFRIHNVANRRWMKIRG